MDFPSVSELALAANSITRRLEELADQQLDAVSTTSLDNLHEQLTVFASRSGLYTTNGGEQSTSASSVLTLRHQIFHSLAELATGPWHTSAKCLVSLAPTLFELFNVGDADTDAKLVAVGKALFILSKENMNDAAFCDVRYVESVLALIARANSKKSKATKVSSPIKTLIYVAGTLKNISNSDDRMVKLLATNGGITMLSDALRWRQDNGSKEIAQLLVQTTTILRNLSTSRSYLKQFTQAKVAPRLCELVALPFLVHQELMVNVSRILGKLTLHEAPRAQLNQDVEGCVGNLLRLVDPRRNSVLCFQRDKDQDAVATKTQDALLVRMYFVLGNLCAGNDRNRQFIAHEGDALPALMAALQNYGESYYATEEEDEPPSESVADVLVKLVRLLANMAINSDVGAMLNAQGDALAVLLRVLRVAHVADGGDHEELMLNIVSCLTNLSYYCTPTNATASAPTKLFIESHWLEIARQLSAILWNQNEEAVLEAARAFGNLSRFSDVLQFLGDHQILDGLVVLLDHSSREIVYTVCGVLMNAALDPDARIRICDVRQLPSGSGGEAIDARALLTGILASAGTEDLEMSCIAAKVLYNLVLPTSDSETAKFISSKEGEELKKTVASVLRDLQANRRAEEEEDESEDQDTLREVLSQLQRTLVVSS